MPDQEQRVALAVIENELTHVKAAVADLKASMASLTGALDGLQRTMDEAKGGWRVLLLVGGAAGSIGAAVSWAANHIRW